MHAIRQFEQVKRWRVQRYVFLTHPFQNRTSKVGRLRTVFVDLLFIRDLLNSHKIGREPKFERGCDLNLFTFHINNRHKSVPPTVKAVAWCSCRSGTKWRRGRFDIIYNRLILFFRVLYWPTSLSDSCTRNTVLDIVLTLLPFYGAFILTQISHLWIQKRLENVAILFRSPWSNIERSRRSCQCGVLVCLSMALRLEPTRDGLWQDSYRNVRHAARQSKCKVRWPKIR